MRLLGTILAVFILACVGETKPEAEREAQAAPAHLNDRDPGASSAPVPDSGQMISIYWDPVVGHRKFSVPRERLLSASNEWDVATGSSSIDLDRLTAHAAKHLREAKHVHKTLRLHNIQIMPVERGKLRAIRRANGSDPDKDVWFLILSFGYATGEIEYFKFDVDYTVLILLDGTIAKEERFP